MGKSSINGPFSMAMLNNQMVSKNDGKYHGEIRIFDEICTVHAMIHDTRMYGVCPEMSEMVDVPQIIVCSLKERDQS